MQWNGPAGFNSTVPSPVINSVQSNNAGMYKLAVSLDDCISKDSLIVMIFEKPEKPVGINNGPLCEGDSLRLSVENYSNLTAYKWEDDKGFEFNNRSAFKADVGLSDSGLYYVIATLNDCSTSDTVSVHINVKPEKPILSSNMPLDIGDTLKLRVENPQSDAAYLWEGPANFSSLIVNPERYLSDKTLQGMYTLHAFLANGCSDSSKIQIALGDTIDLPYLVLYPTPNNGSFFIKGKMLSDQPVLYGIYDALGKMVYYGRLQPKYKRLFASIQLEGYLASSQYFFVLQIGHELQTIKFTVAN